MGADTRRALHDFVSEFRARRGLPDPQLEEKTAAKFYSEDQPREPAGSSEGGRWTRAGGPGGMREVSILPAEPGTGTRSTKAPRKRGILPKGKTRIGLVEEAGGGTGGPPPLPAAEPISRPENPTPAEQTLWKFYDEHRENDFETLAFVDPRTGKIILEKGGSESSVEVTFEEMARVISNGEAIGTHNHPGGSPFSADDIFSSMANNSAEVQAFGRSMIDGKLYLYTLKRPPEGWPHGDREVDFRVALSRVYTDHFRALDPFVKSQQLTIPAAIHRLWHEVWTEMSRTFNLRYTRKEMRP